MKKTVNRQAIVSVILGLAGAMVVLQGSGVLPLTAIPLGLAAVCFGVVGAWSIRRKRTVSRGTGIAISGAVLGALGVLSGLLFLTGMLVRQFDSMGHQGNRGFQFRDDFSANSLPAESATNFTSNLSIVVLHSEGQSISKDSPTVMRAEFFDTHGRRAVAGDKPDYEGRVTVNLRGYSTLQLPKQSFTLHTVDSSTNQVKVSLLGLPAEEDWVLYAPFEDKTLIRDVLAFELTRRMGRYAPRTRYVELFIQDSSGELSMRDYAGVYVLVEKIKRGHDRVDIAKLEPQDRSEPEIAGGYIVKRDHGDRSGSRFNSGRGGPYFFVYPNARKINSEQRAWLSRYFRAFENALYGPDFANPRTGYAAYLDVGAFIDAHWLIELGKNVDGFRYSAYLTKDRGGKINPGPPWDWNRSFGNANYYGGWQVQGWYWSRLRPNEISWYQRLREDPDFSRRCGARWLELRKEVLNPKTINATIDELAAQLDEAQKRNFARWPILGQQVTCNHYVGDTYEDEVRWLKNWIERRIAWIDGQVERSPGLDRE